MKISDCFRQFGENYKTQTKIGMSKYIYIDIGSAQMKRISNSSVIIVMMTETAP